ncbi:MAG: hypothetical protein M0Z84_03320 [Gammaproteobacteria bacterium]|nr:hypothetical protein [Gammaproteobacteria bacterium]
MAIRLRDIPPLRSLPQSVEAVRYNRVRLALRRLANPLQLELPRGIDLFLEDRSWLCLHGASELPLIEWAEFTPAGRALHEPVPCVMHVYHVHAGLIGSTLLAAMDAMLEARLVEQRR